MKYQYNIDMATPENPSLMSGIAIPQWMKNKRNNKFDLDPSTFSPTELDDSFMLYYRHPSRNALKGTETEIITSNLPENIIVAKVTNKTADFSQHPIPCQKYLQKTADVTSPPQTTPQMKIKSAGTDDGFKGEAAMCGSSIVRVATQMVSGKLARGSGVKENDREGRTPAGEGQQLQVGYDVTKRRGSKSLPASPLTSPKGSPRAGRRVANKYFTGAFVDSDKPRGGWILSNLLARREMSQSADLIEETKEDLDRASSTASIDEIQNAVKKTSSLKPKPSELREMNFWSPTSM